MEQLWGDEMFNIKDIFLFNGLDDEIVTRLTAILPAAQQYKRGERIFAPSSYKKALGVFLQGKGVAKADDVFKNTFAEGSVFGAAAVFGAEELYISEITAKTDCTIQFIPEADLREIIHSSPVCAENYIVFLSDRIRYLNKKITQYTGNTAASRLYRYLSDNADSERRVTVESMTALAHLTGIGRTSLYRAFQELESSGSIIRGNEKTIFVR